MILNAYISLSPKYCGKQEWTKIPLIFLETWKDTKKYHSSGISPRDKKKTQTRTKQKQKHVLLGSIVLLFKSLRMPSRIYRAPQETPASLVGPLLVNDSASRGNSISSVLHVSLLELHHIQAFFSPFFDGVKMQDDEKALIDITRLPLNYKAIPVGSLSLEYALGSET